MSATTTLRKATDDKRCFNCRRFIAYYPRPAYELGLVKETNDGRCFDERAKLYYYTSSKFVCDSFERRGD